MSEGDSAIGGSDRATGGQTGEELVEENQGVLVSVVTPAAAAGIAAGSLVVGCELPRKRKGRNHDVADTDMDENHDRNEVDDQHVKVKCLREPHSQIEKRRRDKMNSLMDELCAMIPSCSPFSRRLDKLSVLRMAVEHLRSFRGTTGLFAEASYKPSFLPENELKQLLLRAADGFLFVVGCDRGKILFVSETISKILNYSRGEMIGQSLFDYIHPKDVGKVKEQLCSPEQHPRQRLIDAKTGLQLQVDLPLEASGLCSGARRSFFCRMKYNRVEVKAEEPCASKKKEAQRYYTVHCTGYLRSWRLDQLGPDGESESDMEGGRLSCLVAIGRTHTNEAPQGSGEVKVKPTKFVTRYAVDGKFTFVDQQATIVLGYLPQELLGTSCYEYFHQSDLPHLAERHRTVLWSKEKIDTNCYKFKTKGGSFITLKSQWFSFVNPWTKEVECIVSTNTVVSDSSQLADSEEHIQSRLAVPQPSTEDAMSFPFIPGIASGPGTMIYAGTIGTQIANELQDFNRTSDTSPIPLAHDKSPSHPEPSSSNVPNGEAMDQDLLDKPSSEDELEGSNPQLDLDSMLGPGLGNLSNDEAAMAVIMSLLETDATLDVDPTCWPT
ncbi:hypothetical protein SKAU_G00046660 [Synaphobranchus kaupii]|uniref:Aryl hydrocarbon receptor nuclear translocator-like protein 1 n=1 Tax=Synaphobranchus kaupii TaxID=118154 RepID=A0A9Q1J893_SYNKA|nr:hypothetical protein SKAU_G00046660 [Synaphobranchus kaupii]